MARRDSGKLNDELKDKVRDELSKILEELEGYQRVWIVPWFVQKMINDLIERLRGLVEKIS